MKPPPPDPLKWTTVPCIICVHASSAHYTVCEHIIATNKTGTKLAKLAVEDEGHYIIDYVLDCLLEWIQW